MYLCKCFNYKVNKTAALIYFKGPGTTSVKRLLFQELHGEIKFENDFGATKTLPLTDTYKNLGSKIVINKSHFHSRWRCSVTE